MKQALLESKWYWFIPIYSLRYYSRIVQWVFSREGESYAGDRDAIFGVITLLNILTIIFLMAYLTPIFN